MKYKIIYLKIYDIENNKYLDIKDNLHFWYHIREDDGRVYIYGCRYTSYKGYLGEYLKSAIKNFNKDFNGRYRVEKDNILRITELN